MKLLLDTHVFIWSFHAPDTLSVRARGLLEDTEHILYLSIVSILEMQIKMQMGILKLGIALPEVIAAYRQKNRVQILPLEPEHVYKVNDLPSLHKDPFDRLLVAQAISIGAGLMSADPVVARYPVTVLW